MRLLNASTVIIEEFPPNAIPPYAILSHTWGEGEVLLIDVETRVHETKAAFRKVKFACKQALKDGWQYVWIDTCCIDKSSSADLSEAINSMFLWYETAQVCYAYVADVPSGIGAVESRRMFTDSRWFTRGWTLQELIAPQKLLFFSADWHFIGQKTDICQLLETITGIEEGILSGEKPLEFASIAQRMSWAANRQTTRPEDMAYSLMGIFSVNMPMLYGEGSKAFLRLQEEIMKVSDDQSLFAWTDPSASRDSCCGLLASSPIHFKHAKQFFPYHEREPRAPYSMTNRGLRIELPLTYLNNGTYIAALDCPGDESGTFLTIHLKQISNCDRTQYTRTFASSLGQVRSRGKISMVFVRQTAVFRRSDNVYPHRIFQLRSGSQSLVDFSMVDVILSERRLGGDKPDKKAQYLTLPPASGKVFTNYANILVPRIRNTVAVGIVLERQDGKRMVVRLGSGSSDFSVGFDVMEILPEYSKEFLVNHLEYSYKPCPVDKWIRSDRHVFLISAEEEVYNGTKSYFIDLDIKPLGKLWSTEKHPRVLRSTMSCSIQPCAAEPSDLMTGRLASRSTSLRLGIGGLWRRSTK